MEKRKKKNIIKIAICAVLMFGLVLGAVSLFKPEAKDDYKEIDPSFRIGSIDASGDYKESKRALFTEESFECKDGLKVELDFINSVTYQAFFYDDTDNFISSSNVLDKGAILDVPEGATKARIMIIPVGVVDDDGKARDLNIIDQIKYSGQLTVKVAVSVEEEPEEISAVSENAE